MTLRSAQSIPAGSVTLIQWHVTTVIGDHAAAFWAMKIHDFRVSKSARREICRIFVMNYFRRDCKNCEKLLLAYSCLSVPSVCMEQLGSPTGRIFMKFDIRRLFSRKYDEKFKNNYSLRRKVGTLHSTWRPIYIYECLAKFFLDWDIFQTEL